MADFEKFDLLFKNFYDFGSFFSPIEESKFKYPVDIYENENGLFLEIAATGLKKEDINIEIKENNILHVVYKNKKDDDHKYDTDTTYYVHRGIAKRSFDLGWKISDKFNLEEIDANMENGLLSIKIPRAPELKRENKTIKIK